MTKTELNNLIDLNLPDNTSKSITEQIMRDTLKAIVDEMYDYVEVNVSSDKILTCGTNAVLLLPGIGSGKYYKYHGFLEVEYNTTPFDFADNLFIGTVNNNYTGTILSSFVHLTNQKQVVEFDSKTAINGAILGNASTDVVTYGLGSNVGANFDDQGIYLTTWYGTNATVGDMTFLIKLWYKVIDFGI